MLSSYQIETADFYNIPVDNIKKLVHNFLIKKSIWSIMRTYNLTWGYD